MYIYVVVKNYIVIAFLLIVVFSCKKKDTTPPDIKIKSPAALSQYNVGESFQVLIHASDNKDLQYIKLSITDKNLNDVTEVWPIAVNSNPTDISKYIAADDIHLPTGTYYIHASAFDGTNTGSDYVQITLQAIPLQLQDVYVVETNSGTSSIYKVNNSSTTMVSGFSGTYSGGGANSYNQYLTLGANGSGGVYGYDPVYDIQTWKVNEAQTLFPYTIRCKEDQFSHEMYWSHGSGEVKSYSNSGSVKTSFVTQTGLFPEDLLITSNYVLVEEVGGNSTHTLNVYNKGSGAFVQSYSVNGDIVGMELKSSDDVYMVVNESGTTAIYVYTISSNSAWQPVANQTGTPTDLAIVDPGEILISTTSNLYDYTYQNSNILSLAAGNFSTVAYDSLHDQVLTSLGTQLYYYDRAGNLSGSVSHSSTIKDVWLYYNK